MLILTRRKPPPPRMPAFEGKQGLSVATPPRLGPALGIAVGCMLCACPSISRAALADRLYGFSPFVSTTLTHDSNLLNRPDNGTGPKPESDMVKRVEAGAEFDLQFSRQNVTGKIAASDNQHDRFKERDTEGQTQQLRWNAFIGETLQGIVDLSDVSDQAPIQTGQVNAVQRDQKNQSALLTWAFHPEYAVTAQVQNASTRFSGANNTVSPSLAGLNRNDDLKSVGVVYQPSTGSQLGLYLKNLTGDFPIRQVIGPGQTVSNNFDQDELELLVRWRKTEITSWNFMLSQVERKHEELPVRDYSGTNYRVEWLYQPTAKVQINATLARQIIGISDASNSDALADQKSVGVTWSISPFTTLKINYRPQTLKFNGTDGLGLSPRTDRLTETSVALEYLATRHVLISAIARQRNRQSTEINSDYSADSFSVFLKYAF